jgi:HK97 family phage major capsid protein
MKNLEQLTEEFRAARAEAESCSDRNLDPATQSAALAKAMSLKARLDRARADASQTTEIDRLTRGMGISSTSTRGGSLGAQFTASDTFRWLKDSKTSRGGVWNSPASELSMPGLMATTVDESSGVGGPVVIPQYVPTILPIPTRPLRLADLIAPGTADSNAIIYLKELSWTNAAAATAEGTAKPESALTFTSITELVKKIATFIPVTEEMLEDVGAMQSYLNQRLSLGVELAEDNELLNGSGVAPHLNGFLARAGLSPAQPRGADINADAILKQIGAIQAAVFIRPDAVVMHPTNWQTILLSKDANGRYYGDSPFGTSAASPLWGQPTASTPTPTLWGLPVAITPAITVGTALVGCFRSQSQLFRRGGLRVESTNSHLNFFQLNLIAIRAELREALVVYREAAFGTVTSLT